MREVHLRLPGSPRLAHLPYAQAGTQMRILVCGSRTWPDAAFIRRCLDGIHEELGLDLVLVLGGAEGADKIAEHWAKRNGVYHELYPAKWMQHADGCGCVLGAAYCKTAGFRRNQEMLDSGIDLVLAFWHDRSRGTYDTITRAQRMQIPYMVFEPGSEPV